MISDETSRMLIRTLGALCVAAWAALGAGWSHAQYPDHVIKAIVPFPPGGGTDVFARLVGDSLASRWASRSSSRTRAAPTATSAWRASPRRLADGYTMLFNSSAATVNPAMYRKLRFDPVTRAAPVAVLCEYFNLIVVNAEKMPAKTLQEFVDLLRRIPASTTSRPAARGSSSTTSCSQNKLDVTIIPYRGAGDAITGLLRGDADFMIVNAPGLMQHIASGKLRALAVTGAERQADLPDVPTTARSRHAAIHLLQLLRRVRARRHAAGDRGKLNTALNAITATPGGHRAVPEAERRRGADDAR